MPSESIRLRVPERRKIGVLELADQFWRVRSNNPVQHARMPALRIVADADDLVFADGEHLENGDVVARCGLAKQQNNAAVDIQQFGRHLHALQQTVLQIGGAFGLGGQLLQTVQERVHGLVPV
ncbi:MAG: hypothetical protein B7Z35_04170 [Hydrogenophilales bacterium 12-61-10]|nr:MAG: hypothetical protein B7Z35_04170 [Hydrogenophilales bacterium 12-61-10]